MAVCLQSRPYVAVTELIVRVMYLHEAFIWTSRSLFSILTAVKHVSYDYSVLNEVTVRKEIKPNTDKSNEGEKGCGRP